MCIHAITIHSDHTITLPGPVSPAVPHCGWRGPASNEHPPCSLQLGPQPRLLSITDLVEGESRGASDNLLLDGEDTLPTFGLSILDSLNLCCCQFLALTLIFSKTDTAVDTELPVCIRAALVMIMLGGGDQPLTPPRNKDS